MRSPSTAANYFKETGGGSGLLVPGWGLGWGVFKGNLELCRDTSAMSQGQQNTLESISLQYTAGPFTQLGVSAGVALQTYKFTLSARDQDLCVLRAPR